MRTLAGRRPILQVHPTRRCNLRCAHCYSSSGPDLHTELDVAVLDRAVQEAAALGYGQLSVSGGEPFLYPELPRLLRSGRLAGMGTTAVTNGTVLTPRRLEAVAPYLDVLAVSVDGTPAAHDLVRGSSTAFSRMRRGLAAIRSVGLPFGVIATLTLFNVDELDAVARFAVDEGAAMLQVHPLTASGRALDAMPGAAPDAQELVAAAVEVLRLRREHPGLAVHLDVVSREQLLRDRGLFAPPADADLAELVPLLLVTDEGLVVPLTYDIDPVHHWGSLHEAGLEALAAKWRPRGAPRLAALLDGAHAALTSPGGPPLAFWFDALAGAATAAA